MLPQKIYVITLILLLLTPAHNIISCSRTDIIRSRSSGESDIVKFNPDLEVIRERVIMDLLAPGLNEGIIQNLMETINKNKSPGQFLIKNERPRYHYIEFPARIPIVPSVIDFKHYFSVNIEYLKKLKRRNFVCQLSDLFREDVSVRFAGYLARIGLPES